MNVVIYMFEFECFVKKKGFKGFDFVEILFMVFIICLFGWVKRKVIIIGC